LLNQEETITFTFPYEVKEKGKKEKERLRYRKSKFEKGVVKEIRTGNRLRARIVDQITDGNTSSDWVLLNTSGKFLE
jgi:hypothetical protein